MKYKPPEGPKGMHGKGEYSMKKNPRPVPMKGSMLNGAGELGAMCNADRGKVDMMKREQKAKESQRGK